MSWTKLRGKRWIIVLLGKVSDLFLPIIKLLTVGTKQQFQQLQAKCISVGIVLRLDLWPPSCQLCVTADSVESFAQIWALASTDSVFSASAPLLNGWISVCRDTCNSPTEASVPKRAQLWPECVCCLASLTWSVVTKNLSSLFLSLWCVISSETPLGDPKWGVSPPHRHPPRGWFYSSRGADLSSTGQF